VLLQCFGLTDSSGQESAPPAESWIGLAESRDGIVGASHMRFWP
jgi:hypothetical protein